MTPAMTRTITSSASRTSDGFHWPTKFSNFTLGVPELVDFNATAQAFAAVATSKNRVGDSLVDNTVNSGPIGDIDARGIIKVRDTSRPSAAKRLLGNSIAYEPGDTLTYTISVSNPTPSVIRGTVEDVATFQVMNADGTLGPVQEHSRQAFTIGPLAPFEGTEITYTLTAPGQPGVLRNGITFQCVDCPPPPPVCTINCDPQPEVCVGGCPVFIGGGIVITEMVLDPKRDWNDSSGGNSVPFDDTAGTGVIDANDIWIEVSSGTTGTADWQVCLTDAVGARICKTLGPPSITSQTRLLTGFGAAVLPVGKVEVIDQGGVVRQTLDIAAINAITGAATGRTTNR